MKFFFKASAICCIILICSCDRKPCSNIVSIDSISKAEQAFKHADDQTLIIFDVDETLLMPADALWQQGRIWEIDITKHWPLPDRIKNVFKDIRPDDLAVISNRMLYTQFEPVEQNTISIINALQERNLKIIALTNFGPGAFGNIPSLKEWRQSQLCTNGIDFDSSFPHLAVTFLNLPDTQSGHSEFYKGILFGANNPKGIVLGAFLDQLDFKPTKIIVIDDKEKYLLSIQEELTKRHIHFQGFLYTAAEKQASPINLAVIEYQLERWQTDAELVSDIQACAALNQERAAKASFD